MKNILITGGSGFLGRNLAKKLKNKNFLFMIKFNLIISVNLLRAVYLIVLKLMKI